ncbi:hypothetical protein GMDG_07949 [Pseudogymnoascus destructans 20631-21]|uniref:Uncharacterized protein n=1 Tax=Pseudogymnoascus destructans (strain ATCC MYA-4855 / 20631-21) TaxID=658429 RepID=L8FZC0_PSED2|nr:hypothetical protein GMDG_07949 [Pseudogymnoascus destructans 20631-21]
MMTQLKDRDLFDLGVLLLHIQVTGDHTVQPRLLRRRRELALASANTTVLVINDDEHQQVVVGAGSAAPATAFLGADEECPSLLPPEDPEAELLLDGPIIQGEDEGVDVEILGATDLHLELRKRPFGWEGWGGIFGEGFRATMRAGII